LAESPRSCSRTTLDHNRGFLFLSRSCESGLYLSGNCPADTHPGGGGDARKNDSDLLEKKMKKHMFFYLSALNLLPVLIMGGGLTIESLALAAALLTLVFNHYFLVKIVKIATVSASGQGGSSDQLRKLLFFSFMKLFLLFCLVALIYLYMKQLLAKLFLLIFFQLIIQIVSIKNNYLKF
jgi:hypothetical protein